MKKLLVLVALAAVVATPAFAKTKNRVYAPDHYTRAGSTNNNLNRDFQLGGENYRSRRQRNQHKHKAS